MADPTPPLLEIHDPVDGATVPNRRYTFTGVTTPGSIVTIGGRFNASVQPDGTWALELVMNPGGNTTTLIAVDPNSGLETSVAIQTTYAPPLILTPDALGELEFVTPEAEAVAYLIDVLGPPDSDQQHSENCYERALTWEWAGFEAWITDDGGHGPAGAAYGCSRPPALTNWRVFEVAGGLDLFTPEGIGIGSRSEAMCQAYGQLCEGMWMNVTFDPDFFPYDASRSGIAFRFDKPAPEPTSRIIEMQVFHNSGFAGNPGGLHDDYEALVERLRFRARLVGSWDGTITTPWTTPYDITLSLTHHRYAGTNRGTVARAALYFGIDDSCGESCWTHRRWEVQEVIDGVGFGWLAILLAPEPDDIWAEARLDNIQLSEDGTVLEFDLWRPHGHQGDPGPVHFRGVRAPSS
jgi:hypothetical protein